MSAAPLVWAQVADMLTSANDPSMPLDRRVELAAAISRFAASADEEDLLRLAEHADVFVTWLSATPTAPVAFHAYAACTVANIAFLPQGQQALISNRPLATISHLVSRLDTINRGDLTKEEHRVLVHCCASLQNLTYQNAGGCEDVLDADGERVLNRALKKAPSDIKQFISGALANLALHAQQKMSLTGGGKQGDTTEAGGKAGGKSAFSKFFGRSKGTGGGRHEGRGGPSSASADGADPGALTSSTPTAAAPTASSEPPSFDENDDAIPRRAAAREFLDAYTGNVNATPLDPFGMNKVSRRSNNSGGVGEIVANARAEASMHMLRPLNTAVIGASGVPGGPPPALRQAPPPAVSAVGGPSTYAMPVSMLGPSGSTNQTLRRPQKLTPLAPIPRVGAASM